LFLTVAGARWKGPSLTLLVRYNRRIKMTLTSLHISLKRFNPGLHLWINMFTEYNLSQNVFLLRQAQCYAYFSLRNLSSGQLRLQPQQLLLLT
jgi:hypothetical protein